MSEAPKRLHSVPQLYLRGFAEEAADGDGALHVFDLDLRSGRASTPSGEGYAKSIYDLDGEASGPQPVDETFQTLERDATDVLREITRTRALPESDERLGSLLTFAGLQAARVACVRRMQDDTHDRTAHALIDIVTYDDDRYDAIKRSMAEAGINTDAVTREELREFARSATLGVDEASLARDMLLVGLTVADALGQRRWTLLTSEAPGPELVTTDNPVCLVPRTVSPESFRSRGFSDPNSDVLYPLSSRTALLGRVDDALPMRTTKSVSREVVAKLNTGVMSNALRFIWSRRPRVLYAWQNEIRNDLEYWAARRAEHGRRG